MRRVFIVIASFVLAVGLTALGLAWAAVAALRAAPGEWSRTLRWGPWQLQASVPALLRVATHSAVLQRLAGRTFATPFGPVRWQPGAQPGHWTVVCAPCRVRVPELGSEDIV